MANEIGYPGTHGNTYYAVIRNATNQPWSSNATAFEAYSTAHFGSGYYTNSMTEQGTASGYFTASIPAGINTAQYLNITVYQQAGGSPAEGDTVVAVSTNFWWTGSAVSAAISQVDGNGYVKTDVEDWKGSAAVAVDVAGVPVVDVKYWNGSAVTGGPQPDVNVASWRGGTPLGLNSSNCVKVDALFINGVSTSSVTTINANIGTTQVLTFDSNNYLKTDVEDWKGSGAVAVNTNGVPIVDTRQLVRQGTAQSTGNTTTAIKLDSGASATNGYYNGMLCQVISGTGAPQCGVIVAYNGSTKVATITPAWPTAPDNTSVFQIFPAMADLESIVEVAVSTTTAQLGVNAVQINAVATTSVTAVNANVGTTQPVNFTGTGGSALVQCDTRDFLGHAVVLDANNYPGVNIVDIAGTASVGTAGYVGIDWGQITNKTATVALTNTTISAVTVGGYSAGEDPATLVLDVAAASHNTAGTIGAKINASGGASDPWATALPGGYASGTAGYILGNGVPLNMAQAVPTSNTANTVGDALHGARVQAFGKWVLDLTAKTLTLYEADGTTTAKQFTITLDVNGNPVIRA